MKIRERYIRKTLFSFTFVVLLIWLGVYSFFNFLSEMNSIGQFNYTTLEASKYIALLIPEVTYEHASPVILLGCVLGMGHLATTNQLLIFRVSGMSIFRLTVLTIKTALIFVIIVIAIGEILAPIASDEAERGRSKALDLSIASQSQEGFWIRDGENFINVQKNIDGNLFDDLTIIEVNSSNKISTVLTSENAIFDGKSLKMNNVEIFSIDGVKEIDDISVKGRNSYNKTVSFDQDLIDSLKKEPQEQTTWSIIKQIQYLSDNKLRSQILKLSYTND